MVHVNLSSVASSLILPAGPYPASIADAELVEPRDEGKFPYIRWTFQLTDKPGKAWTNTSLKPNALWKLRELLEAVGADTAMLDNPEGFDFDQTDYIGEDVILVLEIGVYEGKERNEVSRVLAPASRATTPKASAGAVPSTGKPNRRKVI